LSSIEETVREPPLKRFKALFEETNPDSASLMDEDAIESGITQTQPDTGPRSLRSMGDSSLTILREEEEETQNITTESQFQRGKKRRLSSEDDVEIQIGDEDQDDTMSDVAQPSNKRRALENFNAVSPVGPSSEEVTAMAGSGGEHPSNSCPVKSKTTSGAPPGKPDIDDAFLKAIASTKRGKKNEDEFDREFNKLKLTKPELGRHEPEEEWDVLADFGDDSGLRGNFMVIVEVDLYERDRRNAGLRPKSTNCERDQGPNFKKFKKVSQLGLFFGMTLKLFQKIAGVQRTKIDLYASQTENDYGDCKVVVQSESLVTDFLSLSLLEERPLPSPKLHWDSESSTRKSGGRAISITKSILMARKLTTARRRGGASSAVECSQANLQSWVSNACAFLKANYLQDQGGNQSQPTLFAI